MSRRSPRLPKGFSIMRLRNPDQAGFTLVELLLLVGLLALTLGLLLPSVLKANAAADRAVCINNLRQMAIAAHQMHDTYGLFPPVAGEFPRGSKNQGTLHFYALPFMEQDQLYKASAGQQNNFLVWNAGTWAKPIKSYVCPADKTEPADGVYKGLLATTNYAANWLIFGRDGARIASITDGASNTLMFTERYQVCNGTPCAWGYPALSPWTPAFAYYSTAKFQSQPAAPECDPALPQGFHGGAIHVAMADASARLVANTISPQTWSYACTPDDGQPLGADW